MKTIGLIGGMSWESSLEYYRLINQEVKARLGGLHSARCLLHSLDFEEIERFQQQGDWDAAAQILAGAARSLASGGADCILICTNTMHRVARQVAASVELPLIHIADATAQRIRQAGLQKIGLLGTIYTMEQEFYKGRLVDRFNLTVLVPNETDRLLVNRVIYDELVVGEIRPDSRSEYSRIIASLVDRGAEGIVLGCTEIGLLLRPEDSIVPLFDTTRIHAQAAVDFALNERD